MALDINHKDVIFTSGKGKVLEEEAVSSGESQVLQTRLCVIFKSCSFIGMKNKHERTG